MGKRLQELKATILATTKQSVSMQRRLAAYLASMVMVAFGALLLVLTATGIISSAQRSLQRGLELQLQSAKVQALSHFETLAAQGLHLSERLSRILESEMLMTGAELSDWSDNPELLRRVQEEAFEPLYFALQMTDCSGVYFVLDATVNTAVKHAEYSRSGVYLRMANVTARNPVAPDVTLFRGWSEIARKDNLELHNRWNLEFDTSRLPGFRDTIESDIYRLADAYYWTDRLHLQDTWEDAILLCVPVVGGDGTVYGICGFELSELYFRLSYPEADTDFGKVTMVLAPTEDTRLCADRGMYGGAGNGRAAMEIGSEGHLRTYLSENAAFVGLDEPIGISKKNTWTIAMLVSMESYRQYEARSRHVMVAASVAFLAVMILIAFLISRYYVRPIANGLLALQSEEQPPPEVTGIAELDALCKFLQSRPRTQEISRTDLPGGVEDLFDKFIERARTLTPSERNIFQYYIEGYEISDMPDMIYASISTVRKHNRSIYEKLGVASRDEMMLYIDLLRRCGRIQELYQAAETSEEISV